MPCIMLKYHPTYLNLGELGELALWQSLGLGNELSLGGLASASLFNLLLEIPDILWLESLD
jgi:hypothetical protein